MPVDPEAVCRGVRDRRLAIWNFTSRISPSMGGRKNSLVEKYQVAPYSSGISTRSLKYSSRLSFPPGGMGISIWST